MLLVTEPKTFRASPTLIIKFLDSLVAVIGAFLGLLLRFLVDDLLVRMVFYLGEYRHGQPTCKKIVG